MLTLYQNIFDFIYNYIFYCDEDVWENGPMLNYFVVNIGQNSQEIDMSIWLSHTLTIIIMILLVVFAIWLVRWVFKAVSSAFLLK